MKKARNSETYSPESKTDSEFETIHIGIDQFIWFLENTYPNHNTPAWEDRLAKIKNVYSFIQYLGITSMAVDPKATSPIKEDCSIAFEVYISMDEGDQPHDPQMRELLLKDPEAHQIIGYDHPLTLYANQLESQLLGTVAFFKQNEKLVKEILRQKVAEMNDINTLNDNLRTIETKLIYGEIQPLYAIFRDDIRSKIEYLKLRNETEDSTPKKLPLKSILTDDQNKLKKFSHRQAALICYYNDEAVTENNIKALAEQYTGSIAEGAGKKFSTEYKVVVDEIDRRKGRNLKKDIQAIRHTLTGPGIAKAEQDLKAIT